MDLSNDIFFKIHIEKRNYMLPQNYVSGQYAVGTETFSITDTSRKEILGSKDEYRRVAVRMYYPASKDAVIGQKRADILSERKKEAIKKAFLVRKMPEDALTAEYYENISHADGMFPLIVFNHGYNSYIEANTFLCIELASHGYIVASVGHAYEAVETDYPDGSFDLYDKSINKKMYNGMIGAVIAQAKLLKSKLSPEEAYDRFYDFQNKYVPYIKGRIHEWNADILCAVNELKNRYSECIDFSYEIGASGHSFGGALAYYLCRNNDEFVCGINIDGGVFGDYDDSIMKKPFFQICCTENYNVETRPLLNTAAPIHYALFSNMKHMGFTDAKFYIPFKSLSGKMDSLIMYKHLSDIHIRFFDKYLKKDDMVEMPSGVRDGVEYR